MIISLKRLLLFFLIICVISIVVFNHKSILEIFYPLEYEEIIVKEANKYAIDPCFIIAIIYVESKFRIEATSNKGAKGLMQIMPSTGEWIATILDDEEFVEQSLYRPELNIRYGTWYLAQLRKTFDGNRLVMLAAYNGGEGNVDKWLKENRWNGKIDDIDNIPFAETRNYITKVLSAYNRYRYIYN